MIEIKSKNTIDRNVYRNFPFSSAIFCGKGETLEIALESLEKDMERFPSGSIGKTIEREVINNGTRSDEMSDLSRSLYEFI
jgi:hypothetical protein